MSLAIIYDGRCPVCSGYIRYLRLRVLTDQIALADARQGGPEVEAARQCGLRLDDGMVLRIDDQWFHGAEAMHRLALLSTRIGLFNRLNFWLFRSPALSRLFYPALRTGRNVLLQLLGRPRLGY